MLWSSPDVPGMAALLNQQLLPPRMHHGSIVDEARKKAWQVLGPVQQITSEEAYAQMALVMGMTPKRIGTSVRGNGVSSTTGAPVRG